MLKKMLWAALGMGLFNLAHAQTDLYDSQTIQDIRITFSQTNWDYMLDTATTGSDGYIVATSCTINGVVFDSVGVKYKGNSSYSANNAKNPIHIQLDHIKGSQDYLGINDLKLSNGKADPTFVRETLSYWVLGHYMHVPRANYAKVYINGTYYGLMTNVESITNDFLHDHFQSSEHTLVKCNPRQAGGPGGGTTTNALNYLGTDTTLYYQKYEIQSDYGWTDLMHLTDTLNNYFTDIEKILDVDKALWMLAFNNVLVNLDSYTGAFNQNYYLYQNYDRRFMSIVWDLNMSFGSFTMAGSGMTGALDSAGMRNMSPTLHESTTTKPLINKLLSNAMYRRMYMAHLRTITNEFFANGTYLTQAQQYQTLISNAVQTDNNKFYTYTQFQNNLYYYQTASGGTGGSIPGIRSLMNGRVQFLQANAEFARTAPSLTNVGHSPSAPAFGASVQISATSDVGATVYLGYRGVSPESFTRVQMFDDGAHGDGSAGDGVFGVSINADKAFIQYYVYSENSQAGVFSPARAEYEFYEIEAVSAQAQAGQVALNEVLPSNTATKADVAGEFDDWVEIYNNSNTLLDLSGYYLSDDSADPMKWTFPANTTIQPNGYLIVWADDDANQSGLHANFKLSGNGEKVILTAPSGNGLDSVDYPALSASDRSYGRCANGTGSFQELAPTFAVVNNCVVAVQEIDEEELSAYPNPSSGIVSLVASKPIEWVQVYNALGEQVAGYGLSPNAYQVLDLGHLPAGMYFLKVDARPALRWIKSE